MLMFTLEIAALAMLAAQAPATPPAGGAPSTTVTVTGTPPPPSQRRICRVLEQTSSRIAAPRVCHTVAEWDEETRQRQLDASSSVNGTQDRLDQEAPRRPGPGGAPR
jgi:hypothetical protein